MQWKLITILSLLGLGMGYATVYWIPQKAEPYSWLPVFLFCAYIISKRSGCKYFLAGFYIGIVDSIWVAIVHLLLLNAYILHDLSFNAMNVKLHNYYPTTCNTVYHPF
jgi:hypothetical protein